MTKDELNVFVNQNKENYSIQLKRCYPFLYNEIDKLYSFATFGQKLYHFIWGDNIGKCEICNNQCKFDGIHKGYRKRCSYKCLAASQHRISNEIRKCIICGKEFEFYKRREKTTCSNKCLLKLNFSPEVNKKRMDTLEKTMIKKYGIKHPSQLPKFGDVVKQTKLLRYGDENYVNIEKCKLTKMKKYGNENYNNTTKNEATCMKKYGVPNIFHLKQNKTNGKQISKFQTREYNKILLQYPDAKIEEYLPDVKKSVDIFIPSIKKIVECFGDYWHCNPSTYAPEYYHKYVHMNACEIWKRDEDRINTLKAAGYQVEVIWENTNKHFKHKPLLTSA